jgi:hypothetical protein
MSITELLGLARRHIITVALVLIVTLGIAYSFKHTNPGYTETGTVALATNSVENSYYDNSLITTGLILVDWMSGPEGQHQLQQVGVGSGFTVAVVNESNIDDPRYPYPDLTVTSTNPNAAVAHSEFINGIAVLDAKLASLQAPVKVSSQLRVTARVLSDSGPVTQEGSRVRAYGALGFLALVAAYLIARFLDNRSVRSSRRMRRVAGT